MIDTLKGVALSRCLTIPENVGPKVPEAIDAYAHRLGGSTAIYLPYPDHVGFAVRLVNHVLVPIAPNSAPFESETAHVPLLSFGTPISSLLSPLKSPTTAYGLQVHSDHTPEPAAPNAVPLDTATEYSLLLHNTRSSLPLPVKSPTAAHVGFPVQPFNQTPEPAASKPVPLDKPTDHVLLASFGTRRRLARVRSQVGSWHDATHALPIQRSSRPADDDVAFLGLARELDDVPRDVANAVR